MSGFVTLETMSHGEVTVNTDFILKIHPPAKDGDLYRVTVFESGGAVDYRVEKPLHADLVWQLGAMR